MEKLKLYEKSGYVDIPGIIRWARQNHYYFIFLYGGRGTGKTYGALRYAVRKRENFIYLRRLQAQTDMLKSEQLQPFKKLNDDNKWTIAPVSVNKYVSGFYEHDINEDGKAVPVGAPYGIMTGLSTFANLRGFDASDCKLMLFDEFIRETTERPLKGEAEALFNAYETVNRNRELNGEDPVTLLCMANANNLANDIFMSLGLVRAAEKMRKEGKDYQCFHKRKMLLIDLYKSQIAEEKSKTALYDLTRGTSFYDMSIKNAFSSEERGRIEHKNIKEYVPLVFVGEIGIYRHKSRHEFYVTSLQAGAPKSQFKAGSKDLKRFKTSYLYLWREYMKNNIIFEEYLSEILFDKYFD